MSVWDNVATTVTNEEDSRQTPEWATGEVAHDPERVFVECLTRHARIQGAVDDYLTRRQPGAGCSDVHVIQWKHEKDIDSVVVIHKDRRWILWDRDREGRFAYLTSDSIVDLRANGKIADRLSLPPVPSAQFQIGEERISKALYKDLQRHNLI